MKKYIWIGRRTTRIPHPYEINKVKEGWDPIKGWDDPLEIFGKDLIETEIGIKLKLGEVRRLKLELV